MTLRGSESNRSDMGIGLGMGKSLSATGGGANGADANLLGECLMKVRAQLREEEARAVKQGEHTIIHHLLCDRGAIMIEGIVGLILGAILLAYGAKVLDTPIVPSHETARHKLLTACEE